MMKTPNNASLCLILLATALLPLSSGAQDFDDLQDLIENDIADAFEGIDQELERQSEAARQQCRERWMYSNAARTCMPTAIEADLEGAHTPIQELVLTDGAILPNCVFTLNCVVNMDCSADNPCTPSSGAVVEQGIKWRGRVDEVVALSNCGGSIKVGLCR